MEASTVALLSGVYASRNALVLDVWRELHVFGRDLVSAKLSQFHRRHIHRNAWNSILRSAIEVYNQFASQWATPQESKDSVLFCLCVRPDQSLEQHQMALESCDSLDVLWSFVDHLCAAVIRNDANLNAEDIEGEGGEEEEEEAITWSLELQIQSLQKDVTDAQRTWFQLLGKLRSPCALKTADGANQYVEFVAMREVLLQRWLYKHINNAMSELRQHRAQHACLAHLRSLCDIVRERADLTGCIVTTVLLCLTSFYGDETVTSGRRLDLDLQECTTWGATSGARTQLLFLEDEENGLKVDWRQLRWRRKTTHAAEQHTLLHAQAAALHCLITYAPSGAHLRTCAELATRILRRRSELDGTLAMCALQLRHKPPVHEETTVCKTYDCLERMQRGSTASQLVARFT